MSQPACQKFIINPNGNALVQDLVSDFYVETIVLCMRASALSSVGHWDVRHNTMVGWGATIAEGNIAPTETRLLHVDVGLTRDYGIPGPSSMQIYYFAPAASSPLEVHVSGYIS